MYRFTSEGPQTSCVKPKPRKRDVSKSKQIPLRDLEASQWKEILAAGHQVSQNHIEAEFGHCVQHDIERARRILRVLSNGVLTPKQTGHLQKILNAQKGAGEHKKPQPKFKESGSRRQFKAA